MTTYGFIIEVAKALQCKADGSGTVTYGANDFPIPAASLPVGLPGTLAELITAVGTSNISIDYYVSASGQVSAYECWQTIRLYATGTLANNNTSNQIHVATSQTSDGGPFAQTWKPMFLATTESLISVTSNSIATGSGKGCAFEYYGGWSKAKILVYAKVTANLTDWCKNHATICDTTPPSNVTPPANNTPITEKWYKKYWWVILLIVLFVILLIVVAISMGRHGSDSD